MRCSTALAIRVFAQDTLDLATALAASADRLAGATRWLWATVGPEVTRVRGVAASARCGALPRVSGRSLPAALARAGALRPARGASGPFAPAGFDAKALAMVADLVVLRRASAPHLAGRLVATPGRMPGASRPVDVTYSS
jgi:hypothetical protein